MKTLFASGGWPRHAAAILSLVSLLLAGCVSSNRTALEPAAKSSLQNVTVAAVVSQPEIGADVDPSNIAAVTGGGLIAALIDVAVEANRAKKAENIITPIRDAMVDFRAPEVLRTAIATELQAQEAPLPISTVVLSEPKAESQLRKLAQAAPGSAVLVVETDYRLSSDFRRVRVLAQAKLLTADAEGKVLYRNDFATYRRLWKPVKDERAAVAAAWAEDNGAALRQSLRECFAEIAAMIAFDVTHGAEANLIPKEKFDADAPPAGRMAQIQGLSLRGAVARANGQRRWVRLHTGELSSTE